MRVLAPGGYAERARMVIQAMPGGPDEKASSLGVSPAHLVRVSRGRAGWADFEGLASRAGVDARLLLHGPTLALAGSLIARRMMVLSAGLFGVNTGRGRYRLNPRDVDAVDAYHHEMGVAVRGRVEVGGWPVDRDVSVAPGEVEWEPVRVVDDVVARVRAAVGLRGVAGVLVSPFDMVLVRDLPMAVEMIEQPWLPPGVFQVLPEIAGVQGCPAPGADVDPCAEFTGNVMQLVLSVHSEMDEWREVVMSPGDVARVNKFAMSRDVDMGVVWRHLGARVVEGDMLPCQVRVDLVDRRGEAVEMAFGEWPRLVVPENKDS